MSDPLVSVGHMVTVGFAQRPVAGAASVPVSLDSSQVSVVALPDDASAAVIGAPGTGKTTTIVELVADRILRRGWRAEEVLVLTSSRAAATRLRDIVALRIAVPTNGPIARSASSLAFEIASFAAASAGHPQPRLVTGSEQDADFAQLLEGQAADGSGPRWPAPLTEPVRALRGFRSELRELLARATDHGVGNDELRRLGAADDRPEWCAAADFFDEHARVGAWLRPGQFDSSELVRLAVTAIDAGTVSDRIAGVRLVVVDDMQEATASTISLLRALVRAGSSVIAFGDPDVAANAFRGGEPDSLGRLSSVLSVPDATTHVLHTVHRHGEQVRALVSSAVARIGTAAAGPQRSASPSASAPSAGSAALSRISAATPARQWTAIARVLRERALHDDVPWGGLCVVVRSGSLVPQVARALALAEVPTRTSAGAIPLREDRAARALLALVDAGMRRTPMTSASVTEILLGPFGGLDRLGVRRLRLALRAEELAGGGNRSADELMVDALDAPGRLATIDHRVARLAGRVADTLEAIRRLAAEHGSVEELLWLAWDRSGLARVWREQALSAGIVQAEANRNLDGVVALFTAAKRFSERRPDAPAGLFLDEVLDADVPEDTLSPQSASDAVLITTPSGTVGLEFDTVVVAGLQEGVWPNRRPRGSLLAPDALVRIVTGVDPQAIDERKLVLDDELRIFALAVSRARHRVVLAAVANDDESPSVFFSLLPPGTPLRDASAIPLSLRAVTGRLRRQLADPSADQRTITDAAATLASLRDEEVPGADPVHWHGLIPQSSTGPLFDGQQVPVSPSRLERFEESPLDWFIETIAGSAPTVSMSVGTIVHWAMETATDPSVDAVWAAVESRFGGLLFESPWLAEHQRRAARVLAAGVAEYLSEFGRGGGRLVSAETRFSLDVDRATVSGSIDRVERTGDGQVVIVDLKTGNPKTRQSDIDAHAQLGAYQLAYRSGQLDPLLEEWGVHSAGGAKLLWVKEGVDGRSFRESHQAPLNEEGLEGFRTRIRQAALGMAAAEFSGTVELGSYGLGNVPRLRLHRVPAVSSD